MIAHGFDMAVTNAYLVYKRDCKIFGVPTRNEMDLIYFRMQVAESLVLEGASLNEKSKKRPGRPSSARNASPEGSSPLHKHALHEV